MPQAASEVGVPKDLDPDDEILIEMNRIGGAMEVRAVSTSDGLEVVFTAPANAAQADIESLARAKLAYVRQERRRRAGRTSKTGRQRRLDRRLARLPHALAQPDLLGELGAALGVGRRDHRIIGRQAPAAAIVVRASCRSASAGSASASSASARPPGRRCNPCVTDLLIGTAGFGFSSAAFPPMRPKVTTRSGKQNG